ncbi:fatty acid 2-hydroxylase [Patella vulgata]|uniref:fatty acid 2-hydroxylase n=1 Tax=Patella vulgata TaxID=6465 RepID=UPI00217FE5BE|nr:fatty acid 2-hydroxylase [Patella vulgata]
MTSINRIHSERICVTHNGKLYDVTDFSTKHPGGVEILEKHAGQDVTQLMLNTDSASLGHKHSKTAYSILNKYCIGYADDVNKNAPLQTNLENLRVRQSNWHPSFTDEKQDDLIDWNKPIFHQVGFLGENYTTWVHQPVDRKFRLFSSDLFEFFGSSRWWMVPIYWLPISLIAMWLSYTLLSQRNDYIFKITGYQGIEIDNSALPIIVISGVLLWSLVEYSIHRWVFHLKPPAWSPFLIRMHFLFHGQHHKSPMDQTKLVFPQMPATFLCINVFTIYCIILPLASALALLSGSILGYICYDLTHYYLHHGTPTTAYYKSLKTYHMKHHYVNQSAGYGISSKLWDYPFNTLIKD